MSQERSSLLDKMLGTGAAANLRGKVQNTKKKLDAAGLEHKAAKSEGLATKALMEAMRAKIEAAIGSITEGAPPELVDAVMQVIMANAMETPPAPAVEEAPVEETADDVPLPDEEEEEMEADILEDEEEEKALTLKATSLFDALIQSQADITKDIAAVSKSVEALTALTDKVEVLTKDIAAVKKQLAGRPRMASRASETEVEIKDLDDDIKKHLAKKSTFWGASLAPEGME